MWLATISIFIFTFTKAIQPAYETDQLRLVKTVLDKYDKSLRPVVNTSDVTNVTLNPGLFSILDTNEASESITIVLWFRMIWNDVFIQWNPIDYGGQQELLIPINRIWYPDIIALNTVDVTVLVPDDKNYAIIQNDGTVLISVDQVLEIHCKFDIIMFPFDIQNCTLNVISWMHTADQMDIFFETPTDLNSYNPNSEWNLISMTARRVKTHFGAATTAWVNVYYDIVIQRKPAYYVMTFVIPTFVITTISIIGVFAPFNDAGEREEKVTLGLTSLLTMTVVITLIADLMPKSSEGMPLLSTYVMLQIAISAFASLISVIIMHQQLKWTTGDPVPGWILTITRLKHKGHEAHEFKIAAIADHCNKLDQIASYDINVSKSSATRQHIIVLKDIQSMVWRMLQHLFEEYEEEILRRLWQLVGQRLDLLFMFILLILNCILTASVFIIGYSNLST